METDLDIIELILKGIKQDTEFNKKITFDINFNKHDYACYLKNSLKYKDKLICLLSIYKDIKVDLLSEVSRKLTRSK